MIAKARQLDKLFNTFVSGILKFIHKGRIHADINQIRSDQGGTVTGRFSMRNPNLQQIPARSELGSKYENYFYQKKITSGDHLTTHNKSLDWLYTTL